MRQYSPTLGRWVSQDPLGIAAGDSNLYRYVGDNVTNRVHPSGLGGEPKTVTDYLRDYIPRIDFDHVGEFDWDNYLYEYLPACHGGVLGKSAVAAYYRGCIGLCSLRTGSYMNPVTNPHKTPGV